VPHDEEDLANDEEKKNGKVAMITPETEF